MARSRPRVVGPLLYGPDGGAPPISVGSPTWFVWLETNRAFEFADNAGTFVALKERSGRAGSFWRAFHRQDGATRRAYLGLTRDLTLERLAAVSRALALEAAGHITAAPALHQDGGVRQARLRAPPVRRACVSRARLLDRLRDHDEPLTLVVAPAGYGKNQGAAKPAASHRGNPARSGRIPHGGDRGGRGRICREARADDGPGANATSALRFAVNAESREMAVCSDE